MALLNSSCRDVVQHAVIPLLDPCQVCQLATVSKDLRALATVRRTALLLARHLLRVNYRRQRFVMQQRDLFVSHECKLQQLDDRESLQEKILMHLQASPDGIRDLAAALQQALASVAHQTTVAPFHLANVQQDLVRIANFMCLLAWRLHLRSRRSIRSQQLQHEAFQDDEVVVVVLDQEHEAPQQQQQDEQHQPLQPPQEDLAAAADQHADDIQQHVGDAQGGLEPHQLPAGEPAAPAQQPAGLDDQQQQHAAAGPDLNLQQHILPAAAPAASVQHSVAVQTEGLGPTMQEVHELVAGVRGLLQPDNNSLRPGRATLALLEYHLSRQLLAWNMPLQQQPGQQVAVQP